MLRRVENVWVDYQAGLFRRFKRPYFVWVGNTRYTMGGITRAEYEALELRQCDFPVLIARINGRQYWWFEEKFYCENDGLQSDDVFALLVTRKQRQQQYIDRAKAIVSIGTLPQGPRRGTIPDDLKQLVFTRDQGQCQKCGSQNELQFDHIIPLALGGGTSAENLQLLCGPCNRKKGTSLG